MLADNFLGLVTLDPLGAGIPVAYDAIGIEQIDRVIGDSLYEQAKITLALEQFAFELFAFGHDYSRPNPRRRLKAEFVPHG